MDLLNRMDASEPFAFDPAGDQALQLAVRVRRDAGRSGVGMRLAEEAARHFGLPSTALAYSASLPAPLYPPARSDTS